jgi:hypothetical protein
MQYHYKINDIHYQNANNEGMAKHLEANKAKSTYQTLHRSLTICADKRCYNK